MLKALLGRQIVYEKAPVDTEALTALASLGGGEFFRAEDAAGLARAGAAIDALAPSDIVAVPREDVPLAPGLAALAVGPEFTAAGRLELDRGQVQRQLQLMGEAGGEDGAFAAAAQEAPEQLQQVVAREMVGADVEQAHPRAGDTQP